MFLILSFWIWRNRPIYFAIIRIAFIIKRFSSRWTSWGIYGLNCLLSIQEAFQYCSWIWLEREIFWDFLHGIWLIQNPGKYLIYPNICIHSTAYSRLGCSAKIYSHLLGLIFPILRPFGVFIGFALQTLAHLGLKIWEYLWTINWKFTGIKNQSLDEIAAENDLAWRRAISCGRKRKYWKQLKFLISAIKLPKINPILETFPTNCHTSGR